MNFEVDMSKLGLGLSFLCQICFDSIDGAFKTSSVRSTDLTQAANRDSVFYEIKINLA